MLDTSNVSCFNDNDSLDLETKNKIIRITTKSRTKPLIRFIYQEMYKYIYH